MNDSITSASGPGAVTSATPVGKRDAARRRFTGDAFGLERSAHAARASRASATSRHDRLGDPRGVVTDPAEEVRPARAREPQAEREEAGGWPSPFAVHEFAGGVEDGHLEPRVRAP